jgi:KDO2-lipid IV(A) lauroyltransferase
VSRKARRRAPVTELKLNFWSRSLFYLMVGVLHGLSIIPDFILMRLGVAGGFIGYLLDRRHVKIGMRNLAIAFPERGEAERRRILRASYLNLGRGAAEYIRLCGFFYRSLKRRVGYRRFDYWQELQRRYPGRGLLILSAHFGNFELLSAAHAMYGNQISLVHHTQRFAAGDALMTFVRERAGVTVIRKHAAARAVLRSLKRGGSVGIPYDQNAKRSEAVFVPFFNEIAATSSGLARLVRWWCRCLSCGSRTGVLIGSKFRMKFRCSGPTIPLPISKRTPAVSSRRSRIWCGVIRSNSCGRIAATGRARAGCLRCTRRSLRLRPCQAGFLWPATVREQYGQ